MGKAMILDGVCSPFGICQQLCGKIVRKHPQFIRKHRHITRCDNRRQLLTQARCCSRQQQHPSARPNSVKVALPHRTGKRHSIARLSFTSTIGTDGAVRFGAVDQPTEI